MSMFGIAVTKILNGFTYCKDTAKFDRCKKNEKNFTKSTCRHPFARLATVSRAPVGFPPHPPSLSLVFRFFHSSAYARVFLSLFSLIGVILFCPISPLLLFFLIRVTTISFSFFLLIEVLLLKKKESLKVIVLRKAIEGNSYCRNCFSGTIIIRKLYVFYIIYIIITECWEKWKILHFTLTK